MFCLFVFRNTSSLFRRGIATLQTFAKRLLFGIQGEKDLAITLGRFLESTCLDFGLRNKSALCSNIHSSRRYRIRVAISRRIGHSERRIFRSVNPS
jgi:hypothetical protein